jgi:hypothetical protein
MNEKQNPTVGEELAYDLSSLLYATFERVSWIKVTRDLNATLAFMDAGFDFAMEVATPSRQNHILLMICKAGLRPSDVKPLVDRIESLNGSEQLSKDLKSHGINPKNAVIHYILGSQWLSERSIQRIAEIAQNEPQLNIGYIDMAKNMLLDSEGIFIEVKGNKNPYKAKRNEANWERESTARVLRLLLAPDHIRKYWKQREIAVESMPVLSLGAVNKAVKLLRDEDFLKKSSKGIQIYRQSELLRQWASSYRSSFLLEREYYTPLHGDSIEKALITYFKSREQTESTQQYEAALSGASAAQQHAPYLRNTITEMSITDNSAHENLKFLVESLKLQKVQKGANLIVKQHLESAPFQKSIQLKSGLVTTSHIQTFLELYSKSDREKEAAEHLMTMKLTPLWDNNENV